ncbi:hypothetical protein [Thalassospira aquimaris]|uniref:NACHT domain-containing protein n=1 Tax=Thalassospira aquimaris TaxID=3037796 RepID=A0ABT6GF64_9PROT|nr:hypothetical protein [Thalassospira sp. FZY0004]MDG4720727.1 hypothetical protein [Thalassospira sp. FZY0004]
MFAVVIEGLSPNERLKLGKDAEDIADLTLFYGEGDTFASCSSQQILQFKYKEAREPVTSSYLKKTIKKFAATLLAFKTNVTDEEIEKKLSFGFVTNAEFSADLWDAISCLKAGGTAKTNGARKQLQNLKTWCQEEKIRAEDIFRLIEFRASTHDLPAQNRSLRRTVSDWSSNSNGQAAKRLFALTELVREKAQIEGQGKNSIRREDVLDALECDEDQLFPADTRFVDVGSVVERSVRQEVTDKIKNSKLPVFLYADGGVGKTVFIQSLAAHLSDTFEVVVFDCFGGGAYRSEAQARHLPKVGLLQIINELATRGLCDPLLPTDSDQYGLIEVARKRLKQASATVKNQSPLQGILVVLDAADNAQLEADARNEVAFPRSLLASLSAEPIEGVKLLLTARPHRMQSVIGKSQVESIELQPFTEEETRCFLDMRRDNITDVDFSTALTRSRGNARVLEHLVESWGENVSGNAPKTEISVEELIAQKCEKIFRDLHTVGWTDSEIREFFAALSLLPPPIPLNELAEALGWSEAQVNSASSDLAPMLELVKHGAIFRDEPTETYIKDQYAREVAAQQSIAQRLQARQKESIYAAEALPHFLVVISDSDRAYQLAGSDEFPAQIEAEHERRRLKLARLYAAFSLATRNSDLDRVLRLVMQLSEVASANAKGDQFIRNSPALATTLGGSDTTRRLFNDRTGWRGGRDVRLILAYSFADEVDEARIHQSRAIGWINWYFNNYDETKRFSHSGPEAFDIASVIFLSTLTNEFSFLNRYICQWRFRFALSVVLKLITLCEQHELLNGSKALQNLVKFAASKNCQSLALQIGLLSKECGLSKTQLKAISKAASYLSQRQQELPIKTDCDYEMEQQNAIANAAICSLIANSKQSAKRLSKLCRHRRPSSYDYGERHGISRTWIPVQSACVAAWSSGANLSFHHLMPEEVKADRHTKSISTEADLRDFLDGLVVPSDDYKRSSDGKLIEKRKKFSRTEQDEIVEGASCALKLVAPLEAAVLSKSTISNGVLIEFLNNWKSVLRHEAHWKEMSGRDNLARNVGIGLLKILLRHSEIVQKNEAEELIKIISANRFSLVQKLNVLALIARRDNLGDVTGTFANSLSKEILKDDYIEQRGDSFRDLAESLIPLSIEEAKEYYSLGLGQLDQMGSNDFDLIYSTMSYAAEQPGGHIKPALSHRLMNLCQTIFQHEPSKFGWALFGRAAAASIGFPAMYKLIRWSDQDVVDYSYGLPQLACFLANQGHLDARRAAVLLTVCEDHGWHEWQVGTGLNDLLSVANPADRKAIFSLVTEKLDREHSFGGWEGLWESLLNCVDNYEEINDEDLRNHIKTQYDVARQRSNITYSFDEAKTDQNLHPNSKKRNQDPVEGALIEFVADCEPTSSSSIDETILKFRANKDLQFRNRNLLFDKIRESCPFQKRAKFLEALCESVELEFDGVLNLIIECLEAWGDSTAHVKNSVRQIVTKLFAFKGSELFDLRYSGISRQIYRLSKLCDDPKFVLQIVLETIAKERLELGGDEWLQLATSLSCQTAPSTALNAFEDLLSSSAAKVGDEIGEGNYRAAFAGALDEVDVIADIIWHLLGDHDAFVRWSAARSLKSMLDIGLTDDVGRLLDRFDVHESQPLVSNEHHFSVLNAQQWLLMGLSRAALHHGEKLKFLKPRIENLAKRVDLHVVNKLHLTRCLRHIEGGKSMSPELTQLWNEVHTPAHGIVERDGYPKNTDRRIDFGFDYEFEKYKVCDLGRLFGISKNEANDFIADEVIKRWPDSKSMSDFPGRYRYRGEDRFETYREHVQRHAYIYATTTLVQCRPVVRSSYDSAYTDPWKEFLIEEDVSFEDGSWLSDHKDRVPAEARERLLGERKGSGETLINEEELFRKIGLPQDARAPFVPIYGQWTSPDGVHVRVISALIKERGAVGQCAAFSKRADHDLWLPTFNARGLVDRYAQERPFDPLICNPETYPIGIDQGDEIAARAAIARPRLGLALVKVLRLTPDNDKRHWHDDNGALALKSVVWGEWKTDPASHRDKYQDEGTILLAERQWLNRALGSCKQSLIYTLHFTKYKSSNSHHNSSGIRKVYVGLQRKGELPRFWFARKASEAVY